MINIFLRIVILIPLLAGCASTIDSRISLPDEFKNTSDVYALKKPLGRIFDSVYNKKIGIYSVINADTSSRKSKDKLVSSENKGNLINFFLLGSNDIYIKEEEFEVNDTLEFSFEVESEGSSSYGARCRIISRSMDERIEEIITTKRDKDEFPHFPPDKSVNDRSARVSTNLSCSITDGKESLDLKLFSNQVRKTNVVLAGNSEKIIIKDIPIYILIDENKEDYFYENAYNENHYYEDKYYKVNSGLGFYINNEQVSALSFIGKPRVWLKKDISENTKKLLLTASYSLFMFDWLDGAWR